MVIFLRLISANKLRGNFSEPMAWSRTALYEGFFLVLHSMILTLKADHHSEQDWVKLPLIKAQSLSQGDTSLKKCVQNHVMDSPYLGLF